MYKLAAVFVGDLHWGETPPVARSCEESWLGVLDGYMRQLLDVAGDAPVFVAGDLFHKWNASPEVISWALRWLRLFPGRVYAVPGNHDLPNHSHKELYRSAYWTLVEAGFLTHLEDVTAVGALLVHPFGHGRPVVPATSHSLMTSVALVHDFVWTDRTGHPGADDAKRLGAWVGRLQGYKAAFFGDNHKGFLARAGGLTVMNCGGFVRRNSDEKHYRPRVGLLSEDGEVGQHYLDVSRDKFLEGDFSPVADEGLRLGLEEFAESLADMHQERKDFARVVRDWVEQNKLPEGVKRFLLRAVGVTA